MVVYFDTSAFVPLIHEEPGSDACGALWNRASAIVSTRLLFVEAASAISRVNRAQGESGQMTSRQVNLFEEFWRGTFPVEIGEDLMRTAASCSARFGLRGYDAVHCAAGLMINGEQVVAASADRRLLDAWSSLGVATFAPLG